MKKFRLFTLMIVAILVFSSWAPALAAPLSSGPATTIELGKGTPKLAKLRVTNKTGGILYVSMSSKTRSYNFSTGQQGKVTFAQIIQPGKYSITVRTSACRGELHYKRTAKGGTVNLPAFVCR